MLSISNQQPISPIFTGTIGAPASESGAPQVLQGAANVASLNEPSIKANAGGRPELRAALNTGDRKNIGDRADFHKAIDLSKLLADLLSMILKLELGDSKMIKNSSFRETALAKSQANSMIKSGDAAMASGISKATAIGLATFAGMGLSMKGVNRQIKSTRTNLHRNNEMSAHMAGPGKSLNSHVNGRLGNQIAKQNAYHEVTVLKSSRMQSKGSAVQQLASMSGSVIEGGSNSITSALNAKRERASGDASVQSRQTDVEIKARGRNESMKEQTLASIKSVIQADLDVMAHVAQNTRA